MMPLRPGLKTEEQMINDLKKQGYTVEVVNPSAKSFVNKYHVYKKMSIGNKTAIIDDDGKVKGIQG